MSDEKNNERWRDWSSQEIIHFQDGSKTLCNRAIFNNVKVGNYPTCSQCLRKLEKSKVRDR